MDASSPLSKFDLVDRVAIVTGGAGLLGRGYCHTLAAVGAHVIVADIDGDGTVEIAQEVQDATGVETLAIETDVSSPESVAVMAKATLDRFGRVDILVNNAALDPKFDQEHAGEHVNRFEDFPFKAWNEALAVNVTGMFLCAQAVSPAMIDANRGVIVNVSSTYGLVGPDQRLYAREGQPMQYKPVTYTVSKAAVIGLTRYLATYWAKKGVRVNTLTLAGVFNDQPKEFLDAYCPRVPMGRMALAEEAVGAVVFLAADASSYMTGANLVVDGGWSAW